MDLKIKEIMQKKKITSAWLAKETGISKVSISNAVTGKFLPSLENTVKIASVLGVSVSELLGECTEDTDSITCPNCGKRFKMV